MLELAAETFPVGGSPDGRPSFERFCDGPLAAAEDLFSRSFDEMPEIVPGVRGWTTLHTPFFPPIVFYAVLVGDDVEVLSLTVDQDYEWFDDDDPE
jgi:hypothetical protein